MQQGKILQELMNLTERVTIKMSNVSRVLHTAQFYTLDGVCAVHILSFVFRLQDRLYCIMNNTRKFHPNSPTNNICKPI